MDVYVTKAFSLPEYRQGRCYAKEEYCIIDEYKISVQVSEKCVYNLLKVLLNKSIYLFNVKLSIYSLITQTSDNFLSPC